MIPFNLEKALAGEKVVTRDGREVTQLVFFTCSDELYPIVGVAGGWRYEFTESGEYLGTREDSLDLYMASPAPKPLSGFVNIDSDGRGFYFTHKETADLNEHRRRVACIDISQFNEGEGI